MGASLSGFIGASSPGGGGSGGNVTIIGPLDAAGNVKVVDNGVFNSVAPTLVSGSDSPLQLDSNGSLYIDGEGRKNTYRAVIFNTAPLGSANNQFPTVVLQGSATKVVKITRVRFSMFVVTGAAVPAIVVYSVATSLAGGTFSGFNQSGNDQNNPGTTATANFYTVLPTTWSPPRQLDCFSYQLTTVSATTAPCPPVQDTLYGGSNGAQLIVLRGTSQWFGVSISSVGTTPKMNLVIEYTEE